MKKITFLFALLTAMLSSGQELIADGGFENANANNNWYAADGSATLGFPFDTGTQRTGSYRGNLGNEKGSINQDITPTPSVEYTVSFWWRFNNTGSTTDATAGIYTNTTGTPVSSEITLPNAVASGSSEDWQNTTFTFTSSFTNVRFTVSKPFRSIVSPTSVNNSMRFDDVSIVPTSTLAIDELTKFNFKTYPNPASDYLYLSANEPIDQIEVYNLIGKKVLSENILNKYSKLNVSNLSSGVYVLKAHVDGTVGTYKFVKN